MSTAFTRIRSSGEIRKTSDRRDSSTRTTTSSTAREWCRLD